MNWAIQGTMRIDLGELEVKINRVETAIALPMEKFAEFCQKVESDRVCLIGFDSPG